jgi:hypothetical protein
LSSEEYPKGHKQRPPFKHTPIPEHELGRQPTRTGKNKHKNINKKVYENILFNVHTDFQIVLIL